MKMNKILFEQRICTVLKLRYKLLLLLMSVMVLLAMLSEANAFLSKQAPLSSKVLVVEGWLPDYALKEAMSIYTQGGYAKLITTGGPISAGSYLKEYKDYAHLAKATLVAMGMKKEALTAVAAPDVKRERTYHSALALQKWMKQNRFETEVFNLASLGPHTRRSMMLFKKAFSQDDTDVNEKIMIGSIAIAPQEYDPKKWYASSAGVRTTIGELIAYVYVLLLK